MVWNYGAIMRYSSNVRKLSWETINRTKANVVKPATLQTSTPSFRLTEVISMPPARLLGRGHARHTARRSFRPCLPSRVVDILLVLRLIHPPTLWHTDVLSIGNPPEKVRPVTSASSKPQKTKIMQLKGTRLISFSITKANFHSLFSIWLTNICFLPHHRMSIKILYSLFKTA